ncbi:MAG: biopolymer transporter Tol [Microbacteriaceae bacterium]|nr:biopolymer transporter Tol [Microbacteriaceae bacterium]MCL2795577.1 biopolymer transporter Tol [Microbacteriaceae bacterium]
MARGFRPGQTATLWVYDLGHDTAHEVFTSDALLFEAPNWTPDGRSLVVNGDGRLFRVAADATPATAELQEIPLGDIPEINNDHVVSPDGEVVYVSAEDGQLYAVPIAGGRVRRVSHERGDFHHYLHGVSSDGSTLAYIGLSWDGVARRTNVHLLPLDGSAEAQLTDDDFQDDGAEFGPGPDGAEWVYFNSERAGGAAGHAQLFRMRPDGTSVTQLTDDARVNWFPHPSPDGAHVVYVSYPAGTEGHPENVADVRIRLTSPASGTGRDLATVFGGQGAMNVGSWAPDSRRFAYVSYSEV